MNFTYKNSISNFKIIGRKLSLKFSSILFKLIGPNFKSKKIKKNLHTYFLKLLIEIINISKNMWEYYGKILLNIPLLNL